MFLVLEKSHKHSSTELTIIQLLKGKREICPDMETVHDVVLAEENKIAEEYVYEDSLGCK